ncbi:MAG: trypsin-like peptidase domain-containing protein [Candidatus Kaiserbacteria bacterium]|nr:trypsin-like peptidase domain-containing protein [Candidatus Kaiserbacteria bacterium]MCB9815873.1 trypsin-like peptidase domain-containing protein [Candidatus Nomurabacteria bacterium]
MESEQIAKTALISSVITLLIIGTTGYALRSQISDYFQTPASHTVASRTEIVQEDSKVVSTIELVNDAVVSVVVTKDVPVYERYYESYDPFGFFGGFSVPRVRENGTEEREVGGGSGFIVSNDGMIVTNRHVVDDEEAKYTVLLNDGTSYKVEVLARDPQLDIAILKITDPLESALTFVRFGDSESLRLGETVIAIGNALAEFRNSVSVGVISGLSRSIVASDSLGHSEQLDEVIQTDAAINPGNSGGPLLNLNGEVIGVNVATSRGADNIGFALPSHVVRSVVDSVREHGEIVRPFLGVRYAMVTDRMIELNDLPVDHGALVVRGQSADELAVLPGSPADKAGIVENTIILSIDGEELRDTDLATVLRGKEVGQEVELLLWQDGEERTVRVTLRRTP